MRGRFRNRDRLKMQQHKNDVVAGGVVWKQQMTVDGVAARKVALSLHHHARFRAAPLERQPPLAMLHACNGHSMPTESGQCHCTTSGILSVVKGYRAHVGLSSSCTLLQTLLQSLSMTIWRRLGWLEHDHLEQFTIRAVYRLLCRGTC